MLGLSILRSLLFRVLLVLEKNKALNPVNLGLFSADAVVFRPCCITDLIEQFGRFDRGAFIWEIRGCHNFTSNKNKALRNIYQVVHLEGAFEGAFRVST